MTAGTRIERELDAELKRLEIRLFEDLTGIQQDAVALSRRAARAGLRHIELRARLVEADVIARSQKTIPAIRMMTEVRDLATEMGDSLLLGRSHALLSTALDEIGERANAINEAELAFRLLDDDTPLHLQVDHTMVFALVTSLHRTAAVSFAQFDRALELADELGEAVLTIAVLNNKAWLLYEQGRLEEAGQCCDEMVEVSRRSGVALNLSVVDTVARIRAESGDPTGAAAMLRAALELGKDGRPVAPDTDISAVPAALHSLARAERQLGHTDTARELLEECLAMAVDRELYRRETETLTDLAELYAEAGEYQRAYEAQRLFHERWEKLRAEEEAAEAAALQIMYDTTHVREKNYELEKLARHDPLTGLRNRRYLADELSQIVLDCRRASRPLSVVLGDLDHFKAVNDALSHSTGDLVLIAASEVLSGGVTGEGFVVRFGGEEFLAILPGADLEGARRVGEAWCEAMRAMDWKRLGLLGPVTISVGLATLSEHEDVSELMAEADRRMYEAKRAGRDRVAPPV